MVNYITVEKKSSWKENMGLDEYDYSGGGDKDVTSHQSRVTQ